MSGYTNVSFNFTETSLGDVFGVLISVSYFVKIKISNTYNNNYFYIFVIILM